MHRMEGFKNSQVFTCQEETEAQASTFWVGHWWLYQA